MTLITCEAPICTGVSPPVNYNHTHTLIHRQIVVISSDSAHIHLGPTVVVRVTDHKPHTHTGHRVWNAAEKHHKTGVREVCVGKEKGVYDVGASREGEQMPAGDVISSDIRAKSATDESKKQNSKSGRGWCCCRRGILPLPRISCFTFFLRYLPLCFSWTNKLMEMCVNSV